MRRVNQMFHIEGERLVKTSNGQPVPEDEPLFIIRGRDAIAVAALFAYRDLALDNGCNDYLLGGVDQVITDFVAFAQAHPERMKQPGVTRGK